MGSIVAEDALDESSPFRLNLQELVLASHIAHRRYARYEKPLAPGSLHLLAGALGNHLALHLGKNAQQVPHGAAEIGAGIKWLGGTRDLHPIFGKSVEHIEEVPLVAGKAVELKHNHHIKFLGLSCREQSLQAGALRGAATNACIAERGNIFPALPLVQANEVSTHPLLRIQKQ